MTDTLLATQPAVVKAKTAAEKKFEKKREVVKSAILSATEQLMKKNGWDAANPTVDDKVAAMTRELYWWRMNINSSESACLSRIVSVLYGKTVPDIAPAGKAVTWVRFGALIPLAMGSHNYPVGKLVIITAEQRGFREDGTYGNSMDNSNTFYRAATLEEIEKITDETYAALIREFLVMS